MLDVPNFHPASDDSHLWHPDDPGAEPIEDIDAFYGGQNHGSTYHAKGNGVDTKPRGAIEIEQLAWTDGSDIPARKWLYARHLIRKFVSVTVAPGGVGKTSLLIAEATAMATGRTLLGAWVRYPMRVWFINLEDPECEIRRKFAAAWKFFGITEDDIGGRLFVTNARNSPICIAETTTEGTRICDPVVHDIIDTINANRIDVVIVDPFVSSHNINENDNRSIDTVAKTWGRIADKTNCAIELVHHTRKLNGAEANEDSARGASALVYAGRDARALNVMTEKQAQDCRIDERRLYFRSTPAEALS